MRRIRNEKLSLASTNTVYSSALELSDCGAGSFQLSWTGSSPVAAETVWASNDPAAPGAADDTGWIDVTATFSAVNVTGNSGSGFVIIDSADHAFRYYRLKFVNSSGTATVTINAVGVQSGD